MTDTDDLRMLAEMAGRIFEYGLNILPDERQKEMAEAVESGTGKLVLLIEMESFKVSGFIMAPDGTNEHRLFTTTLASDPGAPPAGMPKH